MDPAEPGHQERWEEGAVKERRSFPSFSKEA
jgi:hypothetical protein